MRYVIISDVHGNMEALKAVLKEISKERADALLFLGDSVGYGPEPNESVELLRKEADILLVGNHDHAVLGLTDIEYFNPYARAAIEWTKDVLTDDNREFLRGLPIVRTLEGILLVHSTPKEPEQWHYISNLWDAFVNFFAFKERVCLVGHSHYPVILEQDRKGEISVYKDHATLRQGCRYIINVGSVGQPRDGNPDAAYAVLTEDSIEIKRVSYDIVSTQKKMRRAGLPDYLIDRLVRGL